MDETMLKWSVKNKHKPIETIKASVDGTGTVETNQKDKDCPSLQHIYKKSLSLPHIKDDGRKLQELNEINAMNSKPKLQNQGGDRYPVSVNSVPPSPCTNITIDKLARSSLPSSPQRWRKSSEQSEQHKPSLIKKVKNIFRRSRSRQKRSQSLPTSPKTSRGVSSGPSGSRERELSPDAFKTSSKSRLKRLIDEKKQQRKLIQSFNDKRDSECKHHVMNVDDDDVSAAHTPRKSLKDKHADTPNVDTFNSYDDVIFENRDLKQRNLTTFKSTPSLSTFPKQTASFKHSIMPLNSVKWNPFSNRKRWSLQSEGSVGLYENHVVTERMPYHEDDEDFDTVNPQNVDSPQREIQNESPILRQMDMTFSPTTASMTSAFEYEESLSKLKETGGAGMVKVMPTNLAQIIAAKSALTPPKPRIISTSFDQSLSPSSNTTSPSIIIENEKDNRNEITPKVNHETPAAESHMRNNNNGHHHKTNVSIPSTPITRTNDMTTFSLKPKESLDEIEYAEKIRNTSELALLKQNKHSTPLDTAQCAKSADEKQDLMVSPIYAGSVNTQCLTECPTPSMRILHSPRSRVCLDTESKSSEDMEILDKNTINPFSDVSRQCDFTAIRDWLEDGAELKIIPECVGASIEKQLEPNSKDSKHDTSSSLSLTKNGENQSHGSHSGNIQIIVNDEHYGDREVVVNDANFDVSPSTEGSTWGSESLTESRGQKKDNETIDTNCYGTATMSLKNKDSSSSKMLGTKASSIHQSSNGGLSEANVLIVQSDRIVSSQAKIEHGYNGTKMPDQVVDAELMVKSGNDTKENSQLKLLSCSQDKGKSDSLNTDIGAPSDVISSDWSSVDNAEIFNHSLDILAKDIQDSLCDDQIGCHVSKTTLENTAHESLEKQTKQTNDSETSNKPTSTILVTQPQPAPREKQRSPGTMSLEPPSDLISFGWSAFDDIFQTSDVTYTVGDIDNILKANKLIDTKDNLLVPSVPTNSRGENVIMGKIESIKAEVLVAQFSQTTGEVGNTSNYDNSIVDIDAALNSTNTTYTEEFRVPKVPTNSPEESIILSNRDATKKDTQTLHVIHRVNDIQKPNDESNCSFESKRKGVIDTNVHVVSVLATHEPISKQPTNVHVDSVLEDTTHEPISNQPPQSEVFIMPQSALRVHDDDILRKTEGLQNKTKKRVSFDLEVQRQFFTDISSSSDDQALMENSVAVANDQDYSRDDATISSDDQAIIENSLQDIKATQITHESNVGNSDYVTNRKQGIPKETTVQDEEILSSDMSVPSLSFDGSLITDVKGDTLDGIVNFQTVDTVRSVENITIDNPERTTTSVYKYKKERDVSSSDCAFIDSPSQGSTGLDEIVQEIQKKEDNVGDNEDDDKTDISLSFSDNIVPHKDVSDQVSRSSCFNDVTWCLTASALSEDRLTLEHDKTITQHDIREDTCPIVLDENTEPCLANLGLVSGEDIDMYLEDDVHSDHEENGDNEHRYHYTMMQDSDGCEDDKRHSSGGENVENIENVSAKGPAWWDIHHVDDENGFDFGDIIKGNSDSEPGLVSPCTNVNINEDQHGEETIQSILLDPVETIVESHHNQQLSMKDNDHKRIEYKDVYIIEHPEGKETLQHVKCMKQQHRTPRPARIQSVPTETNKLETSQADGDFDLEENLDESGLQNTTDGSAVMDISFPEDELEASELRNMAEGLDDVSDLSFPEESLDTSGMQNTTVGSADLDASFLSEQATYYVKDKDKDARSVGESIEHMKHISVSMTTSNEFITAEVSVSDDDRNEDSFDKHSKKVESHIQEHLHKGGASLVKQRNKRSAVVGNKEAVDNHFETDVAEGEFLDRSNDLSYDAYDKTNIRSPAAVKVIDIPEKDSREADEYMQECLNISKQLGLDAYEKPKKRRRTNMTEGNRGETPRRENVYVSERLDHSSDSSKRKFEHKAFTNPPPRYQREYVDPGQGDCYQGSDDDSAHIPNSPATNRKRLTRVSHRDSHHSCAELNKLAKTRPHREMNAYQIAEYNVGCYKQHSTDDENINDQQRPYTKHPRQMPDRYEYSNFMDKRYDEEVHATQQRDGYANTTEQGMSSYNKQRRCYSQLADERYQQEHSPRNLPRQFRHAYRQTDEERFRSIAEWSQGCRSPIGREDRSYREERNIEGCGYDKHYQSECNYRKSTRERNTPRHFQQRSHQRLLRNTTQTRYRDEAEDDPYINAYEQHFDNENSYQKHNNICVDKGGGDNGIDRYLDDYSIKCRKLVREEELREGQRLSSHRDTRGGEVKDEDNRKWMTSLLSRRPPDWLFLSTFFMFQYMLAWLFHDPTNVA